jgi:hypothetical protein
MKFNQDKNKIKIIQRLLSNLPRKIAIAPLSSFLVISTIFLLIGAVIFYQKVILVKKMKIEPNQNVVRFEDKVYQDILNVWIERDKEFQASNSKKYLDIFRNRID